jgi:hypothetical protein
MLALAGASPVFGADGVSLVITPTSGCAGTIVTIEYSFPSGSHVDVSSIFLKYPNLFEPFECGIGTTDGVIEGRCEPRVSASACSGRYAFTAIEDGQVVATAYFTVPSTCPGVQPCPFEAAVGGCVQPVNSFALLSPWLAAIGIVGCIGTAAVLAKKRRS